MSVGMLECKNAKNVSCRNKIVLIFFPTVVTYKSFCSLLSTILGMCPQ